MNKQELIDKLKKQLTTPSVIKGSDFDCGHNYGIKLAIIFARQLEEPEKPVVPRCVADFITSEQRSCSTLSEAIDNMDDKQKILDWFYINSETFAKAWIYGYEVEKEKLYTVEIPNPNSAGGKTVLSKQQSTGKLILEMLNSDINKPKYLHLTEAEIKKDFGWAWQFAEEVEEC